MPSAPPPPSPTKRLLLVGWDAADWHVIDPLLEAGRMPHLARLINGGVMASLATLHPVVSPMLWTSIATGKLADKHGVYGFTERDPTSGARPYASTSRRTKALWNILQQALGWRCNVVAWWASYPAEPLAGASVSNLFFRTKAGELDENRWRVPTNAVHPPELSGKLLRQLMHISEVDETLALPFVPRAAEIDQKTDRRLESLAKLITECINVHTVTTALMEERPWDFTAVYFDSIDHFSHAFMPYHPPRMHNVTEEDAAMYGEVMRGIYMFQDMMLGRLVELAGPEATVVVCSDHGFQSGNLRPYGTPREPAGPVLWHREYGMLVMSGPGLKKDERIYGANLLDIVPTLLTLAGLPVGRDMDGKPLLEALENPAAPTPIDSWDDVPGDDGRHPADFVPEPGDSDQNEDLLRQFAALGYIEDPGEDREKTAADADRENQYNLAEVYLSSSRPAQAIPLLETLAANYPWETRYLHQLANAYLGAGYYQAAYDLLERAYPPKATDEGPPVVAWVMFAKARLRLGHRVDAAYYLRHATERMLRFPHLWAEAGYLWLDLRNLDAAEHCFRRAVELDADAASSFQGLSSVHLHRRENAAAIGAALDAVQRLYHLPIAHMNLGIALAREDRFDEAVVALGRAVTMRPNLLDAHRWLAAIYSSRRPDSLRAGVHRNRVRQISQERARTATERRSRGAEKRPLPDIPPASERTQRGEEARPLPMHAGTSGRSLVLVSGLPRSGTSLMMQMLAAGGLPPQTDGQRAADVDNPEGYLEWEAIKRVAREPHLLDEPALDRRAIKAVSALLPELPRRHHYRVVFMMRPVAEIVRSQAKMIARLGTAGPAADEQAMAASLQSHRDAILEHLRSEKEVYEVLEVDYPSLVADPDAWVQRVAGFVGSDLLPHPERMVAAVRTDLHRNRG